MVKANELRVGNILYWDAEHGGAGIVEVVSVDKHSVYGFAAEGDQRYPQGEENEEIEGVPLTPEWLERRLGFEARQEPDEPLIYSALKMDLDIASMEDGYYLRTNNTDPWHNTNIGRKIEYVHQIQNIYLDLTGEELNVKL